MRWVATSHQSAAAAQCCKRLLLPVQGELVLSPTLDSCLQMNLVYQQVVQEALDKLDVLLRQNGQQQVSGCLAGGLLTLIPPLTTNPYLPLQKEAESQLSGPIKEPHREACPASSNQLPVTMFLGRFLKPYFKDKLTGLVRQTGR